MSPWSRTKTARARKRTEAVRGALGSLLIGAFLAACSPPEERDLDRAMAEVGKGYYRISLTSFDRVIKRAPESESALKAAREATRVATFELKDYKKAVGYLQHIILTSKEASEREQAQKQLAGIYFENLQDYPRAAIEYNRLLAMNPPFAEQARYKLTIARANFYMGQFAQAESEIADLLKERLSASIQFDVLALKGNILVAQKRFKPAVDVYKSLLNDFPERSRQENIGLQLAVCHEENSEFRQAIAILETLKDTYQPREYIELRIKRLHEKIRNQPGAKGYRK